MIELADVRGAAARLEGIAHRTRVVTSRTLDELTGASLFLKAECDQRGGAFKFRGAYNKVASLDEAARARGVAAFSSGNHAQAVALAAALHDTRATIVMPEDTPQAKLDATRGYGAEVVFYDRYTEDREEVGRRLAADHGLTLVPPYEDHEIMAGQGTVALELIEEVGDLDVLLVCVGGGGLIAGCSTAAKGLLPEVAVHGVEPSVRDITKRSLAAGERIRVPVPRTIADGQQGDIPGAMTFEVNRRRVDDVLLVTDEEIIDTMALLFERLKVVTEPSGASALAAALAGRLDLRGLRVGVTLSGGNVGIDRFGELMARRGDGLPRI
ncbi:pyridoxal-phosphate dependent enzyme [Egibacter rhizosphaerae]|uniref:threonine ammonia-lyase n=1 Tax=Egibacter rhizosphaerae TaxID=1670831 RepID=A0A411YLF0_9ACTN|nr:pyridoxal-phosphate dependent enzyme [Egibacter rhizosphaerae]